VLCLIVPLGVLAVAVAYVRLNISPSLPYGLYRLHPVAHPLQPGVLVVVHVPGWSAPTQPFLKPVAAVGGDGVCRMGQALVTHGKDYGMVYDAWRGEPLPAAIAAETCVTVPPGYVFLASTVDRSLDSRYFGVVRIADLTAIATPLWTW
jgi:type IV secretory pathway protease TraF